MGKAFVCVCHDVTTEDVERAVRDGYSDPETVKRFTAALMGPCQGKWCARVLMAEIARATGTPPDALRVPSARPPAVPVRLGQLATAEDDGA
jgi:bacterioferritin-associated ferredoxin